jgi:hypothetical protein
MKVSKLALVSLIEEKIRAGVEDNPRLIAKSIMSEIEVLVMAVNQVADPKVLEKIQSYLLEQMMNQMRKSVDYEFERFVPSIGLRYKKNISASAESVCEFITMRYKTQSLDETIGLYLRSPERIAREAFSSMVEINNHFKLNEEGQWTI